MTQQNQDVPRGTRKRGRPRKKAEENQLPVERRYGKRQVTPLSKMASGRQLTNLQDSLRIKISNHQHVVRLETIQQKLMHGANSDSLTQSQIAAYGRAADISLRLLNKILPDLKTTEIVQSHADAITIDAIDVGSRDAINAAISAALGLSAGTSVGGGDTGNSAGMGGVPSDGEMESVDNHPQTSLEDFDETLLSDSALVVEVFGDSCGVSPEVESVLESSDIDLDV